MDNQEKKEEPKKLEAQSSNSRMEKRYSKEEANELLPLDYHLSWIEERFEGVTAKIDALTYVSCVENAFQNQKERYTLFLRNLKYFFERRICSDELRRRINLLFRGNMELRVGFNRFLTLYKKQNNAEEPLNTQNALSFLFKVKHCFGGESNEYKMFLDILNSYRDNTVRRTDVYFMVARLFGDELDLLEEFRKFYCSCSLDAM